MKILFYFGGFSPVGGIETFCKNLLCYLQSKNYDCRLVCWGQSSPLLQSIQEAKIKIIRNPWRWGCRWNLPDWLLLPIGLQQIKQADLALFGKLFPFRILRQLKLQVGNHTKFIYITPYKPIITNTNIEKNNLLEMLNFFDLVIVQATEFADNLYNIGYQGRIEVIPYIPQEPGRGNGEAGVLVCSKDPQSLALTLENLIASPELRNQWGQKAYKHNIEHYSIQKCAKH